MEIFRELFEAKLSVKTLPKTIGPGKYGDADFYGTDKNKGEYEYVQIEYTPDGTGDYGDGEYNQGYTLTLEVEIKNNKINLNTQVTDLGRPEHKNFSKKYSNLTFDDVKSFETTVKKIIKEFDNL